MTLKDFINSKEFIKKVFFLILKKSIFFQILSGTFKSTKFVPHNIQCLLHLFLNFKQYYGI